MLALKGEIKGLAQRMDSFEKRLDEVKTDLQLLEVRMERHFDAVDKRFDALERQWEKAIDIRERLAALEARLEQRKPN